MTETARRERFERVMLPHLDAAYNLARWLTRSGPDAEDLTQEALLRAFRAFDGFRGDAGRAWLLAIVRNTCFSWLRQRRIGAAADAFDEEKHSPAETSSDRRGDPWAESPEDVAVVQATREAVIRAVEVLPIEYREAIILRELEGLSYKEIGDVLDVPVGTVMSRLSRGRSLLRKTLAHAKGDRDDV